MKAHFAPKRLSKQEAMQTTQTALECVAPAVVAAVLFTLYKRGWHKDRICKLYDDIICMFSMPEVFGQRLDDEMIEKYLTEKIGIDWTRLIKVVKVCDKPHS